MLFFFTGILLFTYHHYVLPCCLQAAVYGMSQAIPDRSLVTEIVMEYVDALYNTNYKPLEKNGMNGHAKGHSNGHI